MQSWWAIGEGPDGAVFFVYDADCRTYLSVSPIVPEEAEDLGSQIDTLLDRIDPRRSNWVV